MYRATRGIVAIVLVLALAAGTQAVGDAAATDAAAGIAGTWEGRIDTPTPLDVVVRVEFEDGAASGTVDTPAQGARNLRSGRDEFPVRARARRRGHCAA